MMGTESSPDRNFDRERVWEREIEKVWEREKEGGRKTAKEYRVVPQC